MDTRMGIALAWGLFCVACATRSQEQIPQEIGAREQAAPNVEVDLDGVAKQARTNFRGSGQSWRAYGGRHTVTVEGPQTRVSALEDGRGGLSVKVVRIGRESMKAVAPSAGPIAKNGRDGSLSHAFGDVIERRSNSRDGVHQSWSFPRRPPGSGALETVLSVDAPLVGEDTRGLIFGDRVHDNAIVYGHATWVDARGRTTPVRARYSAGRIFLRLPGEVVDDSAYPAVLDPLITPEQGIDPPLLVVPSGTDGRLARSSGAYLAVWVDNQHWGDIYGARIDAATGQVLDPAGQLLVEPLGKLSITPPAVASNGSDFLVLWIDQLPGQSPAVYARRIQADGTVLDGPVHGSGIRVSQPGQVSEPSLLFDGANYYATWISADSGPSSVVGVRLSGQTGQPLGPPGVLLAGGIPTAMASNGTNVLVTSGGLGIRVDTATGATLDATPIRIAPDYFVSGDAQGSNALAFDGTYYVRIELASPLRMRRIRPSDGFVLDPPDTFNQLPGGIAICSVYASYREDTKLIADGSNLVMVWSEQDAILASRLDVTGGRLLDATATACGVTLSPRGTTYGFFDAAGAAGGGFVLGENQGERFSLSNLSAMDAAPSLIMARANRQWAPAVASNGTDFLAAWLDERGGRADVYAARIGADGTVLDTTAIPIADNAGSKAMVDVASDGTDYLIAYTMQGQARASRVRASDGVLLDGDPTKGGQTITSSASSVSVTSDGASYLLAWSEGHYVFAERRDATLNRLGSQYSVFGSISSVVNGVAVGTDANVDPTRRTYLVAWSGTQSSSSPAVARAIRIRATSGSPVDSAPMVLSGSTWTDSPFVIGSQNDFLVLWGDNSGSSYDVFGRRISALDGQLLEANPFPVATGPATEHFPAGAFDGNYYWSGWSDSNDLGFPEPWTAHANRVSIDGKLQDSPANGAGIIIANADGAPGVDLASNQAGRVLAVYANFVPVVGDQSWRIRAKFLETTRAELDGGIVYNVPPKPDAGTGAGGAPEGGTGSPIGTGGTPGVGGSVNAGGASSTGGALGDGGALGTGGISGTDSSVVGSGGEQSLVDGGRALDGGGASAIDSSKAASSPGGCGCRMPSQSSPKRDGWMAFLALTCLACFARRRDRRSSTKYLLARNLLDGLSPSPPTAAQAVHGHPSSIC